MLLDKKNGIDAKVTELQKILFNPCKALKEATSEALSQKLRELFAREILKGHCHEHNFKNSTARNHLYSIGNLLTVIKFS